MGRDREVRGREERDMRRGRVCARVHWHLYTETGKHKQKVFYLFLSLIAEITVYFQTAPRCGELAGLLEHPHRTEGEG